MAPRDPGTIPIPKASEHNTSETANTDILATALSPSFTPSLFRVMISVATAAKFSEKITKAAVAKTVAFNSGQDVIAGALYMFDHLVHEGDTINYQLDGSVTLNVLRVQEIVAASQ